MRELRLQLTLMMLQDMASAWWMGHCALATGGTVSGLLGRETSV